MDPATIAMGVQLAATALQAVQQYQAGTITQDEAHVMLVAAANSVSGAIAAFNAATFHPAT